MPPRGRHRCGYEPDIIPVAVGLFLFFQKTTRCSTRRPAPTCDGTSPSRLPSPLRRVECDSRVGCAKSRSAGSRPSGDILGAGAALLEAWRGVEARAEAVRHKNKRHGLPCGDEMRARGSSGASDRRNTEIGSVATYVLPTVLMEIMEELAPSTN